jgi:hypothetical protein
MLWKMPKRQSLRPEKGNLETLYENAMEEALRLYISPKLNRECYERPLETQRENATKGY